jgi:hypothetical protein
MYETEKDELNKKSGSSQQTFKCMGRNNEYVWNILQEQAGACVPVGMVPMNRYHLYFVQKNLLI